MPARMERQAEPIPGYRLLERLGGGGFGEVWKAQAPGGVLKAIKFVYGDLGALDGPDDGRAQQELKSLERVKTIRHPFILGLDFFQVVDGQLLIVMDLADRSLWDRYRECREQGLPGIPRTELLQYMTEAAEALDLMNLQYNLQHLDIKPQNLFLDHRHVKIADFGLVKALEGHQASITGGVTPVYAAPETFDGKVTRYTDQYSLAIVYQELLTGRRPFRGNNARQLILQHLQGEPDLSPLPEADRPVVARALAKDYRNRFPSCEEFVAGLRAVSGSGQQGQRDVALDETPTPQALTSTPSPSQQPSRPDTDCSFAVLTEQPSPLSPLRPITDTDQGIGDDGLPTPTPRPPSRIERTGDGTLFPALIIGLGASGGAVVREFRRLVGARLGDQDHMPHICTLVIDTDAKATRTAAGTEGLSPDQVLLTPLSRASRYIRARGSLPPIDTWLTREMLYRLPREPATSGIRFFGRLALIEHYRYLVAALRRDLRRITARPALEQAKRKTNQELQSDWPTVFLVANLGGGTGGGMFLDAAYIVRDLLRAEGYDPKRITGLFWLPPAGDPGWTDLAQANTYASLLELFHFIDGETTFFAQFEEKGKLVRDGGPPFDRCALWPVTSDGVQETAEQTAEYLFRRLLTPLHPSISSWEREQRDRQPDRSDARFLTVGVHSLTSAHRQLVQDAARLLGKQLLRQWTERETEDMAQLLIKEIGAFLRSCDLEVASLVEVLETKTHERFGQEIMAAAEEWITEVDDPSDGKLAETRPIRHALESIGALLGTAEDFMALNPAPVPGICRDVADELGRNRIEALEKRLLSYLDRPGFRYPAAARALRVAQNYIESRLAECEKRLERVTADCNAIIKVIHNCLEEWERRRSSIKLVRSETIRVKPTELLRSYTMLRSQQLWLQRAAGVYLSFRGRLSDLTKDLQFCRNRFEELKHLFDGDSTMQEPSQLETVVRTVILPESCSTWNEAVQHTLRCLPADQVARIDHTVDVVLKAQFPNLASLCLQGGDWPQRMHRVITEELERFVTRHWSRPDVAELVVTRYPSDEELLCELEHAWDQAAPPLEGPAAGTLASYQTISVPDTAAGRRIGALASQLTPDMRVDFTADNDEIIIFRELLGVAIKDLPQMGSAAQEAYDLASQLEHFTPHCRLDISAWRGPR